MQTACSFDMPQVVGGIHTYRVWYCSVVFTTDILRSSMNTHMTAATSVTRGQGEMLVGYWCSDTTVLLPGHFCDNPFLWSLIQPMQDLLVLSSPIHQCRLWRLDTELSQAWKKAETLRQVSMTWRAMKASIYMQGSRKNPICVYSCTRTSNSPFRL